MNKRMTQEDIQNMITGYQDLVNRGYKNKEIARLLGVKYRNMNKHLKKRGLWVDTQKRTLTFEEYKEARRNTNNLQEVKRYLKINNDFLMSCRHDWDVLGDRPEDYKPGGLFYDKVVSDDDV